MQADQLKQESEQRLQELGLAFNPHLPIIESLVSLNFRSAEEIAKRILILAYLYAISFGIKRREIKQQLKQYKLYDELSFNEKRLLSKLFLSPQEKINISWLTEAIEVLGFCIGLWDSIELQKPCDEDRQADSVPIKQDPTSFISQAKLISEEVIYKQVDMIYRLHWISKHEEIPELGLGAVDIYQERHKAINWIIFANLDWDEISTDT